MENNNSNEIEQAFFDSIDRRLDYLLSENGPSQNILSKIKRDIKNFINKPKQPISKIQIADFTIKFLVSINKIKNQLELDESLKLHIFLNQYSTISDFPQIKHYLPDEPSFKDENDIDYGFDELSSVYLKDNSNWYKELGLSSNPFPSETGLFNIEESNYDKVVLKTRLFRKYIQKVETELDEILDKSIIFYGEFGCGKSTLFDYLSYLMLMKNILPIRIILKGEPTLERLHRAFNELVCFKLSKYISNYSSNPQIYTENKSKFDILNLMQKIQQEREQIGFVFFLDGLHKSQDGKDIPLKFLIELQTILEFYRDNDVSLSIFIAGSNDWASKIENDSTFSGSIYLMEKFEGITAKQADEMLNNRLNAFSTKDFHRFFQFDSIALLIDILNKEFATETTFRQLILKFTQRGFISKGIIRINPLIEQDILLNIINSLKKNSAVYNLLLEIRKEFQGNKEDLIKLLTVISNIFESGNFQENNSYIMKNRSSFKYLEEKQIIIRFSKKKKSYFGLNKSFIDIFRDIVNKVKLSPIHYLSLIFKGDTIPDTSNLDYLKILETIKRYHESSTLFKKESQFMVELTQNQYFPLIAKIENNNFKIDEKIFQDMKKIFENALKCIYIISKEPIDIQSQEQIFKIFRYTWLDNRIFTQFFLWMDNWKLKLKTKEENQQLLKIFVDAYEAAIIKFGKHLRYNLTLIVGSEKLNNHDKKILNDARACFSSQEFMLTITISHDHFEERLRNFIFNILYLKFGDEWEKKLIKKFQTEILAMKKKESDNFLKPLNKSINTLYHLSRGAYFQIINNNNLWDSTFKYVFGNAYKGIVKETLETLANEGHLDAHNRPKENIEEIAIVINHNLKYSKQILESINSSYQKLLKNENVFIKSNEIKLSFRKNKDSLILNPIIISEDKVNQIFKKIIDILDQSQVFDENYLNLDNRSEIEEIFGLPYREVFGCFGYLIKQNIIKIVNSAGSKVLFDIIDQNSIELE